MPTVESSHGKIKFPDTMSPDEIRAVLKVMESPGKYAKLKGDSERIQECMDQIAGFAKAMESSSTKTIDQVVKSMQETQKKVIDCMDIIQKQQAELIKAHEKNTGMAQQIERAIKSVKLEVPPAPDRQEMKGFNVATPEGREYKVDLLMGDR